MSTAQQQIYQQVQLLPFKERLELIRRLFAETVKADQFQLADSMTVSGDIDQIIEAQRASVVANLNKKGELLSAELAND